MDVQVFRLLASEAGEEVLQAALKLAPREADFLRHFTALSRRFPPELARLALETAILRQEARLKFPFAEHMFFTRPALEQASSHPLSEYRAGRFSGSDLLFDLACSIGADSLSLASIAPTLGFDLDPLRLAMAQTNLKALGLDDRSAFIQADLLSPLPCSNLAPWGAPAAHSTGIFFDPARRSRGRRVFSIHDYQPPLPIIESWLARFPALSAKISPGVDLDELHPYDAEVEFISLHGELKEAVLWFGPLKSARRRATLLPGPYTISSPLQPRLGLAGEACPSLRLPLSEPRAYLYEPDPAILRAGLVQDLGVELDAAQLDPDIAYLTADQPSPTPFARLWAVEAWFPFGLKRLRHVLRQRGISRVTVKKRGSPLQPEDVIQALRLSKTDNASQAERVVFLTHLRGKPIVILCFPEELANPPSSFARLD